MRIPIGATLISTFFFLTAASQPVRLEPSSRWLVDYAENSCRLVRLFGERKNRTLLRIESSAPLMMDMLLIGKSLEGEDREVPAKFLPLGGETFDGHRAQTDKNGDPAILWSTIQLMPDDLIEQLGQREKEESAHRNVRPPATDLAERAMIRSAREEFATKTTGIEIGVRRNRPVVLDTGSLGDPIKAFDKCTRESLRDWGVDPDLEDKIIRRAFPRNVDKWFSSADYPPGLVRQRKESVVTVRVLVDTAGSVTKCTTVSHFKEPEFSQITCGNIMKRAKFEPAELADGKKVPSYYINRVIFRLEG